MSRAVLVTRHPSDCVELQRLLDPAGIKVRPYPVLRIEEFDDLDGWRTVLALLARPDIRPWLVMSSPRAPQRLIRFARHHGAKHLLDCPVAVVGDATVVVTSVVDGSGLDTLIGLIGAGRTLALIGASGTGKSSLVNALVGDDVLEVGEVRTTDARGRHTTTARELVRLPRDAGLVLDTPGIRAIGLWEAEEALARVFGDLEERANQCRFNDCAHRHEPGCAIRDAVAAGEEDPRRVERYLALVDELASQRSREEDRRRQGKDIARRRRAAGASRRRKGRR